MVCTCCVGQGFGGIDVCLPLADHISDLGCDISHAQHYYDHLIQILNQSPLLSWCHNQYIFHPSIINHDHHN